MARPPKNNFIPSLACLFSAIILVLKITSAYEQCDPKFTEELLRGHNYYRAHHGVGSLTLNTSISKWSQAWSDYLLTSGTFQHRFSSENLFYQVTSDPAYRLSGDAPVSNWYNELLNYPFFGTEPNLVTFPHWKHLTAMLWAQSTDIGVGCSTTVVIDGYGQASRVTLVAVNYWPEGNLVGGFADNVKQPATSAGYPLPAAPVNYQQNPQNYPVTNEPQIYPPTNPPPQEYQNPTNPPQYQTNPPQHYQTNPPQNYQTNPPQYQQPNYQEPQNPQYQNPPENYQQHPQYLQNPEVYPQGPQNYPPQNTYSVSSTPYYPPSTTPSTTTTSTTTTTTTTPYPTTAKTYYPSTKKPYLVLSGYRPQAGKPLKPIATAIAASYHPSMPDLQEFYDLEDAFSEFDVGDSDAKSDDDAKKSGVSSDDVEVQLNAIVKKNGAKLEDQEGKKSLVKPEVDQKPLVKSEKLDQKPLVKSDEKTSVSESKTDMKTEKN